MTYKDLLVHLDGSAASAERTRVGLTLARSWNAHLTGLCLVAEPFVPPMLGASIPPDVIERQRIEAEDAARKILARFGEEAAAANVPAEPRLEIGPVDSLARRFARQARHADLSIVGQPDPATGGVDDAMLAEAAFLDSGRPALVVPFIGARSIPPQRVTIAWDGGREAARAIADALPLMRMAASVVLLVVDAGRLGGRLGEEPGADMARHLARHGLSVTVRSVATGGLGVGDVVLAELADDGSDLLVMGGFGHSRLRELVLGGVTRHLLEHMTVPVLLAH